VLKSIACGLVAAFALAGCSTVSVNSDYDRGTDFSQYRTFSFISDSPLLMSETLPVSPLFEGRAIRAIQTALVAKGYRYVDDRAQADFVVSFTLGARDQIRVTSYPSTYRGNWRWGGVYHQDVDVRNYTEGTLAIDLFDVEDKSPFWHGWAVKSITRSDYSNPTPVINKVVESILADFPPS
jgi:hypothetical protein